MSNYDKYPKVKINNFKDEAWEGYSNIAKALKQNFNNKKVVVIDCYPGVDIDEIINGLKDFNFSHIIKSDECALKNDELTNSIKEYLTDDRVFGVLTTKKLESLFINEKIEKAKDFINNSSDTILVIGVGASLITKGDIYVYADLARWEIQLRYRNGMSNWNIQNNNAPILDKYKRGFFVEWRMADRHKQENFENFDFVLDTNKKNNPKLVTSKAFFNALDKISKQPFRVVPYFDPGVWGGQWMKKVCNLDKSKENFAWSFDGVPEENSLLLQYGDIIFEIPSINLVFYKPIELLGEKVYSRFGKEFPIRFDFLDTICGQNLSLQVHPTTEYIQQNFGMHYTQDESYYILDCKDDAVVYLGLKENTNKGEFINALKNAQLGKESFDADKYINKFKAKKHDHFLIPAGTIHCSGSNVMVLEISATPYIFTFKLWDWDRLGLDGLPRPIHINHGEKVIDFNRDTNWVCDNLIDKIEVLEENKNHKKERTGLHKNQFIETIRDWSDDIVYHSTNNSVNMLNLVEGECALVESPDNEFEPFEVHYAETFIIPEFVKKYTIRPYKNSIGKKIATIKAFIK